MMPFSPNMSSIVQYEARKYRLTRPDLFATRVYRVLIVSQGQKSPTISGIDPRESGSPAKVF
jgi:hypothetical protein